MDVHVAALLIGRHAVYLGGGQRLDVEICRLAGAVDAEIGRNAAEDRGKGLSHEGLRSLVPLGMPQGRTGRVGADRPLKLFWERGPPARIMSGPEARAP